jgi:hypothetical protein
MRQDLIILFMNELIELLESHPCGLLAEDKEKRFNEIAFA